MKRDELLAPVALNTDNSKAAELLEDNSCNGLLTDVEVNKTRLEQSDLNSLSALPENLPPGLTQKLGETKGGGEAQKLLQNLDAPSELQEELGLSH